MTVVASELVRGARLSRQLSMSALADLAGVPKSTVSRIEAGKLDPTVTMLSRLTQAAGFRLAPALVESATDDTFASILNRLDIAELGERGRLLARFPAVASTSPVARRTGASRVEVPGSAAEAVARLTDQGQSPVVSAAEGFYESVDPTRSFVPIVYVDDPAGVTGFERAAPSSYQVMLLLPTTANVRAFSQAGDGARYVTREWATLDVLASPGRQAEFGAELLESLNGVVG